MYWAKDIAHRIRQIKPTAINGLQGSVASTYHQLMAELTYRHFAAHKAVGRQRIIGLVGRHPNSTAQNIALAINGIDIWKDGKAVIPGIGDLGNPAPGVVNAVVSPRAHI